MQGGESSGSRLMRKLGGILQGEDVGDAGLSQMGAIPNGPFGIVRGGREEGEEPSHCVYCGEPIKDPSNNSCLACGREREREKQKQLTENFQKRISVKLREPLDNSGIPRLTENFQKQISVKSRFSRVDGLVTEILETVRRTGGDDFLPESDRLSEEKLRGQLYALFGEFLEWKVSASLSDNRLRNDNNSVQ